MPKLKLADWAKKNGLSYLTANRHFHAGMIPNAQQLDSGTILVEDDSPESNMSGSSSNDAMSLFLKKTVEFSKNSATVEDFAAYVISNFSLKLAGSTDGPRYSKQKPKPEDVQKHFQQFIPKGEKPKSNSFVMDPEAFADEPMAKVDVSKNVSQKELVKEFAQAVTYGSPVAPRSYAEDVIPGFTPTAVEVSTNAAATSAEGTVTRSVDLNSTPQPINYTGSNNLAFSSSLTSMPTHTAMLSGMPGSTFTTAVVNNGYAAGGIDTQCFAGNPGEVFFTNSTFGANLDSLEEVSEESNKTLESKTSGTLGLTQPRSRRGRKPSKR